MSIGSHIVKECAKVAAIPVVHAVSTLAEKANELSEMQLAKSLSKAMSIKIDESKTFVVLRFLKQEKKVNQLMGTYKYVYYYSVIDDSNKNIYDVQVTHNDILIKSDSSKYKEKIACKYGWGGKQRFVFTNKKKEIVREKINALSVAYKYLYNDWIMKLTGGRYEIISANSSVVANIYDVGKHKRIDFHRDDDDETIREYIVSALIPEMNGITEGCFGGE